MNLRLLQLGDSALPIGGYSHSWGLEAAVDRGLVRDAPGLERWSRCWLRYVVAPCEGVIVAAGCSAASRNEWSTLQCANELLWVSLTPPTLRAASATMGEQLLQLADGWSWARSAIGGLAPDPRGWHHAPVFAALAAVAGADSEVTLAVYLHQAALGAVNAGVRSIPVGHTHGQQVLARLHEEIKALAATGAAADLETAGSCCPAYEVLCHAQAGLYTRLFRS